MNIRHADVIRDFIRTNALPTYNPAIEWDEASCTQLVYLYSELTQKFEGRIETFLTLKGSRRHIAGQPAPEPTLRLASIDIGGGTTDLMITTYRGEANRVLHPEQTFREGFRVAGDDLVHRVISAIVIPRLQDSIEQAGGRYVGEKMRELFGGDRGGQDQQVVQRRRQFSVRVLIPLAEALENSGGTELIASQILSATSSFPAWVSLLVLFVVTMTLSDFLNNVATTLIAAPIAVSIAIIPCGPPNPRNAVALWVLVLSRWLSIRAWGR